MTSLFTALLRRQPSTIRHPRPGNRLNLVALEDRVVPVADILVSTDGAAAQQMLQEFTPGGSLVRQATIPAGGATAEDARDIVADPSTGSVLVYNGTNDPYLSTY